MSQTHIQKQVDLIAKHEQDFLAQRTRAERIGDAIAGFAGSLPFVCLHIAFFASWIGVNIWPHTRHFDPAPFSLLGTLVALEAIILASFILMRQSRVSRRADERDHLMLQVLLLTEKEMTTLLSMNSQIAKQVGLETIANNAEVRELSKHTSIEDVAQQIKEGLPSSE